MISKGLLIGGAIGMLFFSHPVAAKCSKPNGEHAGAVVHDGADQTAGRCPLVKRISNPEEGRSMNALPDSPPDRGVRGDSSR